MVNRKGKTCAHFANVSVLSGVFIVNDDVVDSRLWLDLICDCSSAFEDNTLLRWTSDSLRFWLRKQCPSTQHLQGYWSTSRKLKINWYWQSTTTIINSYRRVDNRLPIIPCKGRKYCTRITRERTHRVVGKAAPCRLIGKWGNVGAVTWGDSKYR